MSIFKKDFNLIVQRLRDDTEATLGYLSTQGYQCFSLEDQRGQTVKVPGEKRIPAGRFKIVKRTHGRFYQAYSEKFGHEYALALESVPGFTDILIHTGNTDDHTAGCILVGKIGKLTSRATVAGSYEAYKDLWVLIDAAFDEDREVWIDVRDEVN